MNIFFSKRGIPVAVYAVYTFGIMVWVVCTPAAIIRMHIFPTQPEWAKAQNMIRSRSVRAQLRYIQCKR